MLNTIHILVHWDFHLFWLGDMMRPSCLPLLKKGKEIILARVKLILSVKARYSGYYFSFLLPPTRSINPLGINDP